MSQTNRDEDWPDAAPLFGVEADHDDHDDAVVVASDIPDTSDTSDEVDDGNTQTGDVGALWAEWAERPTERVEVTTEQIAGLTWPVPQYEGPATIRSDSLRPLASEAELFTGLLTVPEDDALPLALVPSPRRSPIRMLFAAIHLLFLVVFVAVLLAALVSAALFALTVALRAAVT